MPNIYFVLFEFIVYGLFALCLRHAWRSGISNVLLLFSGAAFGILLELATIRQLNSYRYGQFVIMVLDVPFCVGVAWSIIIYSVLQFSNASSLPYWLRPVLDGLLALNIDLANDAIATRLGMWDWGKGLEFQYFGVPFANFWAWFWVVASFSLGFRLLAQRPGWIGKWLPAFLAVFIGLAGVLATNALIVYVVPKNYQNAVIILTLLAALTLISLKHISFYQQPVDILVFWVPFIIQIYFLLAGIISGLIFTPPILFGISLIMLSITTFIHRKSILHLLKNR